MCRHFGNVLRHYNRKYYKFVGEDDRFVANQMYAINGILERCDISFYTLKNRLRGLYEFSDSHIKNSPTKGLGWAQFMNKSHKISAEWLRRPIV
jgi:hypothetical protein